MSAGDNHLMAQFKRPTKAIVAHGIGDDDGGRPKMHIVAPNCNVCQSPYRPQIDRCLASGWTQAGVIEHFNQVVGEPFFKKDSMSRHKKLHLSILDQGVRSVIEARARQFKLDSDEVGASIMTKAAALDTIILRGLDAIAAGDTFSEPKDVLAAIQLLEKMESEWKETAIDEMLREFRAFSDAVREVVGEDLFAAIWASFEARLGDQSTNVAALNAGPMPPVEDPMEIEGEVTEEADDA